MQDKDNILKLIKTTVNKTEHGATLILYGSYARGDHGKDCDVDIQVIVDKKNTTRQDQKRIKYPLYDIEFETGIIISPVVLSKKDWESKHPITPFYDNISREGKVL